MVVAFAALWAVMMLLGFGTHPLAVAAMVVLLGYAVFLFFWTARTMRAVRALPDGPVTEADIRSQKRIGRSFGVTFGVEMVLIMAAAVLLGNSVIGGPDFIAPVIALIVGVHFYPLGALFRTRVHAVLATPVVLVAVVSIVVIARGTFVQPMIGICCLVTSVCVALMATYILRWCSENLASHTCPRGRWT